ncbi:MAG: hypothetical protein ACE5HE_03125 [Phycisphaerae bacterium]
MTHPEELELSVVVSGRNDNWNGSFDRVAPFALAHNAAVLSECVDRFELILVEWAPLEDRSLLSERFVALTPKARCFVVPRAIHDGFRPGIAFLQYHARNVGIRRARGRRVVAANADILLTSEVVKAVLDMPKGVCLRAPRYDIDFAVIEQKSVEDVTRFCAERRNRVAEHEIVRRHGTQIVPWFENAAGDFASMHRADWLRCRGFHERVDASMGVDAELIGQVRRLGIELHRSPHPVFHIDHAEEQAGRLHMPPFSESGYHNPDDWGLATAEFTECRPGIHRCSPDLAAAFTRVGWPPPIRWPEKFDGLTQLHDRSITRRYDAVVFCGLSDSIVGFSLYLDLAPGQARVWDDGTEHTSRWKRELNWGDWPDQLVPQSQFQHAPGSERALYVAMAGSPAHVTLTDRGVTCQRDLLVVEPGILTTFSPLAAALEACSAESKEVIILGFGRHGRLIADWLTTHRQLARQIQVWDDSLSARDTARDRGFELVKPEGIAGADAGQLILISPAPATGGTVLAQRLAKKGLVEGKDWIACPFLTAREASYHRADEAAPV